MLLKDQLINCLRTITSSFIHNALHSWKCSRMNQLRCICLTAQNMINVYLDLLKKYCTGKRFLELQHLWFMHIHLYFEDNTVEVEGISVVRKEQLIKTWSALLQKAAELGRVISVDEQRIILSTLSYDVFQSERHKDGERYP